MAHPGNAPRVLFPYLSILAQVHLVHDVLAQVILVCLIDDNVSETLHCDSLRLLLIDKSPVPVHKLSQLNGCCKAQISVKLGVCGDVKKGRAVVLSRSLRLDHELLRLMPDVNVGAETSSQ